MPARSIVWVCLLLTLGVARPARGDAEADIQARLQRANDLKLRGDNKDAAIIYESLLSQLRGTSPSSDLSEALRNLADIANSGGQYSRAVSLSLESANVCRSLGELRCEAGSLSDAGAAYLNSGKYSEASAEFAKALALSKQTGDAETSVLVMNNLGNVYYYEARYSDAYSLYTSAAQLVEKFSAEDWSVQWRSITNLNLATLYERLRNDQRAVNIYREELASRKVLLNKEVAHMLSNLGTLYRHLGDPAQALSEYHEAEKYYASDKDAVGEVGVLMNIGIVLALDQDRLQDALGTFDRALALSEHVKARREIMHARLYRAETLYRMHQLPEADAEFQRALNYTRQLGTREEQWKALYSLGKIDLQNGNPGAAETKFRDAISKIETLRSKLQLNRLKTDFLADKRDVYDALIGLLLDRNDVARSLEFMERSRARDFQDRFFGGDLHFGSITVPFVQSHLAPDTALIEFWTGAGRVAAVWVTRTGAGIVQKRFSPEEMEQSMQVLNSFGDNLGTQWQQRLMKVAALIPENIPPFRQPGYSHLLIVPDGFLSQVPFELLPAGTGRPLIETHDVTYMPSAVLVARQHTREFTGARFPWQPELIAFGDPLTSGAGSLIGYRSGSHEGPLPGAAEEIHSIVSMTAGRSHVYLQAADRKLEFLNSLRSGAPVVHVSTHAVADMDDPERSRLLFSPDIAGQPSSFLFLKEIYDLDLRKVDLATLSACDTEKGRLIPGEGIQAFSRALLAAGSRSAITTLWRVPDRPTAEFMKQFYYFLLEKHKTKAEALRLAKLQFFHSHSELSQPRFWAAFVLNGEGNKPVPLFISWQALLLPAVLLAGAAAVFYWRFYQARNKARCISVAQTNN